MIEEEVEKVKKQLVELIIRHLEEKKITAANAKQLATEFLKVLPISDYQDMLLKLNTLGNKYPEAKVLYIQELKEINDTKRNQALTHMRNAIAAGNIDQAINMAKGVSK